MFTDCRDIAAMSAMFHVSHDFAPSRLTFRIDGFWSMDTVGSFRDAMRANAIPFVRRAAAFDVLADMSDFPPQSQPVAAELQECMMRGIDMGMRRTACLASSPLTRLQFKRVAASHQFRFFDTQADACSWLDDWSERVVGASNAA